MKNNILLISALTVFIFMNPTTYGQGNLKIGHLNTTTLLQSMPENDSASVLLEKDRTQLQKMLEQMETEYDRAVKEYRENLESYSDLIRSNKESDIMDLEQKIQTFQQNASLQLQQRNMELFQPVYDKLQRAIDAVALQHQFTYILDVSQGSVVYVSAESQNIDTLVLRELGIR